MKGARILVALLMVCSPLLAETPAGYERMVLSIAPSQALCAWFSRYDTRLLVFNDGDREARAVCLADGCASVAPRASATITGPITSK